MLYRYDAERARSLLPLLRAIAREIRERRDALRAIEHHLAGHAGCEQKRRSRILLRAEAAQHRRGLFFSMSELDRLGRTTIRPFAHLFCEGGDHRMQKPTDFLRLLEER